MFNATICAASSVSIFEKTRMQQLSFAGTHEHSTRRVLRQKTLSWRLHCTMPYLAVLYCTALYCVVLYRVVLYCTVLYSTVPYASYAAPTKLFRYVCQSNLCCFLSRKQDGCFKSSLCLLRNFQETHLSAKYSLVKTSRSNDFG